MVSLIVVVIIIIIVVIVVGVIIRILRCSCSCSCWVYRTRALRGIQTLEAAARCFSYDVRVVVGKDIVNRRVMVFVGHTVLDQGEERLKGRDGVCCRAASADAIVFGLDGMLVLMPRLDIKPLWEWSLMGGYDGVLVKMRLRRGRM